MTLLDILMQAAGQIGNVRVTLQRAIERFPELRESLEPIIAALDTVVSQSNLVALAEALPAEIAAIASGKIDPRPHAGDAI